LEIKDGEEKKSHITVSSRISVVENLVKKKLEHIDLKPLETKLDKLASTDELENYSARTSAQL